MHGRSYLGNNMVALIEQALDQNARDVAEEYDEDHPDPEALAREIDRVYDEERDRRSHINLDAEPPKVHPVFEGILNSIRPKERDIADSIDMQEFEDRITGGSGGDE
jgi:hypothetical protein